MELQLGQIGLVNLTLRNSKGKIFKLQDVIFSQPYDKKRSVLKYSDMFDRRTIIKTKQKEDLFILEVELIKELGWRSKIKSYTEVKASTEIRNKITGAYE